MKKEKFLDKYYKAKMHWESVNRKNVLQAMEDYATYKVKDYTSSRPYIEADLQGCELCERFADIELMIPKEDCYICQLCYDSAPKK